jgi:hypothetical protein
MLPFQALDSDPTFITPQVLEANSDARARKLLT